MRKLFPTREGLFFWSVTYSRMTYSHQKAIFAFNTF